MKNMKSMKNIVLPGLLITLSSIASAEEFSGPAKAAACAACHGNNGISISDEIPNLAGQKVKYLSNQLKAFRDGKRKNPLMGPLAAQLSDSDIEEISGFFGSLSPAMESVTGSLNESLNDQRIVFPENYQSEYELYTTVNRADNKQVRYLYASSEAVAGAKDGGSLPIGAKIVMEVHKAMLDDEGNPVEGSDGFYLKDTLAGFGVMEKGVGWGDEIPEVLRNDDWNYAFFNADKTHKAGINQAGCMACHKPLDSGDYMFSADALRSHAAQ